MKSSRWLISSARQSASSALTCWVISDGRRGIENQALGLAEGLARQTQIDIKRFTLTAGRFFRALPPRLQLFLKSAPSAYGLSQDLPEIAIGCGRQAIAPLLSFKRRGVFTIYVQDPRLSPELFDVVIAPSHDPVAGENVMKIVGSPNRVTAEHLQEGGQTFADEINRLPERKAAFMIGGSSKTHNLTMDNHTAHMSTAMQLLDEGYGLMVTTSRRTPKDVQDVWRSFADRSADIWYYDGQGPNPYFAFLQAADIICVTEESTNMLTEACTTGTPVFRLPMRGQPGKFQALYEALEERCRVRDVENLGYPQSYAPLRETDRAAAFVWDRYEQR